MKSVLWTCLYPTVGLLYSQTTNLPPQEQARRQLFAGMNYGAGSSCLLITWFPSFAVLHQWPVSWLKMPVFKEKTQMLPVFFWGRGCVGGELKRKVWQWACISFKIFLDKVLPLPPKALLASFWTAPVALGTDWMKALHWQCSKTCHGGLVCLRICPLSLLMDCLLTLLLDPALPSPGERRPMLVVRSHLPPSSPLAEASICHCLPSVVLCFYLFLLLICKGRGLFIWVWTVSLRINSFSLFFQFILCAFYT